MENNTTIIDALPLRQLQCECARALSTIQTSSANIKQFNKLAHHDSQLWYKAVIDWYMNQYNGLPSKVGPGAEIKLKVENNV